MNPIKKIILPFLPPYNRLRLRRFYRDHPVVAKPLMFHFPKKILLLVPHVDDEIIGLGGLLQHLSTQKLSWDMVYLTSCLMEENDRRRQEEARVIFEKYGGNKLSFFSTKNHIEGEGLREHWEETVEDLSALLKEPYDAIFTVSFWDAHPDHYLSTKALALALERNNQRTQPIYLYESSNLLPQHWVNSYHPLDEKALENKRRDFKVFSSQSLMDFDIYLEIAKNKRFALKEGALGYEFFSCMPAGKLIEVMHGFDYEKLRQKLPYRTGNHRSYFRVIHREKKAQAYYKKVFPRAPKRA